MVPTLSPSAHGANPNWKDPHSGLTPLLIAAQTNAIANLEALLAAGADRMSRDKQGKSALDYAFSDGEARALLLKAGVALWTYLIKKHQDVSSVILTKHRGNRSQTDHRRNLRGASPALPTVG